MRIKGFLAVLAFVCLLAGCVGEGIVAGEKGNTTGEKAVPISGGNNLPYVMPFTGEPIEDEVTQRPILATINNYPDARPQSGIASADVIYEMLAEGDVTRFLALFQSEIPETIGPIRSARDYFIELAAGLDAFYIAHGYSPEAQQLLESEMVDHVNGMQYDGILFKRSSARVAPHNSYFPGENIETAAEKVSTSLLYQKKVSYTFYKEDESVKIGTEAESVAVTYSHNDSFNSLYTYDRDRNIYTRQSGEILTIDELTNEPLALSNVLFFEMGHSVIDSEGRREIDLTSGGSAFVFQQGVMREVRWENIDGVLKAVEDDGSEVKLVPGKTWVHFVPSKPGMMISVKYS